MNSTFGRAIVGFVALTVAITFMALVALWAIERFGGGVWWASLVVVLLSLVAMVSVYTSTLHEPVYDWIKEPKRQADAEQRRLDDAAAEARRKDRQS